MSPLDLRNPIISAAYESGKQRGLEGKDPSQGYLDISDEETRARNLGYHEGVRLRDLEGVIYRNAPEPTRSGASIETIREDLRMFEARRLEDQERETESLQRQQDRFEEAVGEARIQQQEYFEQLQADQEELAAQSDYKAANPGDYQCPFCLFITLLKDAKICCKCRQAVPPHYWPEVRRLEEAERLASEAELREHERACEERRKAAQMAEEQRKLEAEREWKRKEPERKAAAAAAAAKAAAEKAEIAAKQKLWQGSRWKLVLFASCYGLLFGLAAAIGRAVFAFKMTIADNFHFLLEPPPFGLLLLAGMVLAIALSALLCRAVAKAIQDRLNH